MRVGFVCKPGARGAKKLSEKYGERLLCVRYRYDEAKGLRYKTVEIIEEQSPWKPKIAADKTVYIKVEYEEAALRDKLKAAGGKWNGKKRLWEALYVNIKGMGLNRRIVKDK